MKKHYLFIFAILSFGIFYQAKAQTTLSAGDLVISVFNSDGNDGFGFVLLADISAGTNIKFTDRGWFSSIGSFDPSSGEGTISWTANVALSKGTEVFFTNPGAAGAVSSGAYTESGSFSISSTGDQILVYQGTDASPTFIYAFNEAGGSIGFSDSKTPPSTTESDLPPGLTLGTNAFEVTSNQDNYQYDCTSGTSGDANAVRARFMVESNYNSNVATTNYPAAGCTFFAVTTPTWNGSAWSPSAPTATDNAIIDGAYAGAFGSISCADLTINSGVTFTIPSGTITVAGNFDNNGTAFTQTGGTFTMSGSSAQTIDGANSFSNLTINNSAGVTLNSATDVTGILALTSGTLASGGNLTLKSTGVSAGSTATVDFSGSGTVSGNVTVERFLDGGAQAGYRYISTNVTGQTLAAINDDVALVGLNTTFSPGSSGSYTWNTTSPYPNHFIYNESLVSGGAAGAGSLAGESLNNAQFGWETGGATSDAFNPGSAIALRIGGSNATISFTGALQTADVPLTLTDGGETESGWHLVGNPYAATLDWNLLYDDLSTTGVEQIAYVLDANGTYTGAYTGYNAATDEGVNGGTKNIASGQGFFVQASDGGGSMTLKTSHTISSDAEFFRTKGDAPEILGELRMLLADENENEDELLIYFAEGMSEKKDLGDASKFFEGADGFPSLASTIEGRNLMMDCREPVGSETQTFDLALKAGKAGTYTLKASEISKFPLGTEIMLEDLEKGILIDLNQINEYRFDLAKSELSENRFKIHLKNDRITSLANDLAERGVSIFSTQHQVRIQFADLESAKAQISIFDLQGKLITKKSNQFKLQTDLELPGTIDAGIYIVKVGNAKGVTTKKLYVEK